MDNHYHFIGIGGIGMSSLAMILLQKGKKVSGSDLTFSSLMKKLKEKGAEIFPSHSKKNIVNARCIIYSTAIDKDNTEFFAAKEKKMKMMHRSDLLCSLLQEKKSILVAGTHGKTTVSSLLSHVLYFSGQDPSFSIGGEVFSLPSHGRWGKGNLFVVEADESDRSFLKFSGFGAIVTNVEEDHMEYWKDIQDIKEGYRKFIDNIHSSDHLFWCYEDENLRKMAPKGFSYGFSKKADIFMQNFHQGKKHVEFDAVIENQVFEKIALPLIGKHNALNALGVFAMCIKWKIDPQKIKKAFLTFQGVKRRCECIGEYRKTHFYDDYAHHPTEILVTLQALREKIEEKRMVVLFQPHRFSRTKYFFQRFGKCFDSADELILTDIYSAYEKQKDKISIQSFFQNIKKNTKAHVTYLPKEKVVDEVSSFLRPLDVFLSLGAGDVTNMGRDIFRAYQKKENKYQIALLYGGNSPEHEISCLSAKYIHSCLDQSIYEVKNFYLSKEGNWSEEEKDAFSFKRKESDFLHLQKSLFSLFQSDVCLPIFHGPKAEDGLIAAFLEMFSLAYVGCDFRTSSLCMNKSHIKKLALMENIMVAPFIEVKEFQWLKKEKQKILNEIQKQLYFPLFVKPVHLGSSIGISQVENKKDLQKAIDRAFSYDNHVIVEKKICGQEIEVAVLGSNFLHVMTPGEILTKGEFYDYEQKYEKKEMKTIIPAQLSKDLLQKVKDLAKKLYCTANCKGLARVDFFVDAKQRVIFNEINPMPGFTAISLYPKMCYFDGWKKQELVDRLIISALYDKRKNTK